LLNLGKHKSNLCPNLRSQAYQEFTRAEPTIPEPGQQGFDSSGETLSALLNENMQTIAA